MKDEYDFSDKKAVKNKYYKNTKRYVYKKRFLFKWIGNCIGSIAFGVLAGITFNNISCGVFVYFAIIIHSGIIYIQTYKDDDLFK